MMSKLNLTLPPALEPYREPLAEFFNGMIFKLNRNAHKDKPEISDIPALVYKLLGELGELGQQLNEDRFDPNALEETWDTSNFAFLIYLALTRTGTVNPNKRKPRKRPNGHSPTIPPA